MQLRYRIQSPIENCQSAIGSLVRDHPQDFWQIGIADHSCSIELAFPLRILRSQDMAQKCFAALYLPRPRLLEALRGAFVCF